MANPLRESSNQSARLTEASLPYIQQGADFMGGVPRGVQIAGGLQQQQIAARQLVMQESQHEAEMQDLALRGQLYQGELALRREQAMTRSAEAAAELQWRQTQNALSKMQQDESRVRIQRDVATLPPRKRKDGKWEVADYGDGGSVVWSTVEESDPRVQDYVNKQQDAAAEIDLKRSQAEANRGRANGTVRYEPTYQNLVDRQKALESALQRATQAGEDEAAWGYRTPDDRKAIRTELSDVTNRLRNMAKSPTERKTTSENAAPAPDAAPVADQFDPRDTQTADWIILGLQRRAAWQSGMDEVQLNGALGRAVSLMRASGQDVDPVTGERQSDQTLTLRLLQQLNADPHDPNAAALREMFKKLAAPR